MSDKASSLEYALATALIASGIATLAGPPEHRTIGAAIRKRDAVHIAKAEARRARRNAKRAALAKNTE